jgi:hypothetical protein
MLLPAMKKLIVCLTAILFMSGAVSVFAKGKGKSHPIAKPVHQKILKLNKPHN